jgi:anaerobic nitric oxide reductase flavorubredoxin
VKQISELLDLAGFTVVNEGLKMLWMPDEKGLETCEQFGEDFAKSLNA